MKSKLVINYVDHHAIWKEAHPKGPTWEEGFGPQGAWHKDWDKAIQAGKDWVEKEIFANEEFILEAVEFVGRNKSEYLRGIPDPASLRGSPEKSRAENAAVQSNVQHLQSRSQRNDSLAEPRAHALRPSGDRREKIVGNFSCRFYQRDRFGYDRLYHGQSARAQNQISQDR